MSRTMLKVVSYMLLIVFVVTACSPTTPAASTAAPTVAPTTAPKPVKDTLTVAQQNDATTLDPQKQGKMPDMNILINMFDTLVTRDENNQLAPSLATAWKATSDTVWEFTLRKDVKFHNGEPFNAAAAKFSLDRLADPATKSPIAELKNVKAVNVVDDTTIAITTDGPDPILPTKMVLFGGVMMPPQYVKEKGDDFVAKNPVGTGPYKFVSWAKDNQVVMEANAGYFRGAPKFKKLIFRTIPNVADMVAALKAGEIDIAAAGITGDIATSLKGNPDISIVMSDWIRTFFISLDTSVAPLDKKEVRQALNYAVDVQAIIDTIMGGYASRVSTIIPKQNFGYDASIKPYEYNPTKAKELLTQAGYPNGFTIKFDGGTTDLVVAQAIAGQLEKVGVKCTLNLTDATTLVANMAAKKAAPMYIIGNTGWTMDGLSNFQSYARSDRRYARQNDPDLDKLVDIEEKTIDPKLRQDAFTKAQQILRDQAYFIYLYQGNNIYAMRNTVSYKPNVIGYLWMYTAAPK